jgi:surface carbohydrate biosynthesis protein (TIGR04326 family)
MEILNDIQAEKSLKITITVKPHPANPVKVQDYPKLIFSVTSAPISELLENTDIAYTGSVTSAAVDAYCADVPVISLRDPNTLNISPLRGCKGVTFISTSPELIKAIQEVINGVGCEKSTEAFFHLDGTLTRWKAIINGLLFITD